MKRQLVWMGAALFGLCLQTGCDGNDVTPENNEVIEEIILKVSGESKEETRVNFMYDGGTQTMSTTWSSGDAFKLYSTEGVYKFQLKTGEEGKQIGSFSLVNAVQGSPKRWNNCRTFFPASKAIAASSWEQCEFTIAGQQQTGNDNTAHLTEYGFMTLKDAPYTIGTGGNPINFQHEAAVFRIEATLPAGETPKELTLKTACESAGGKDYGFVLSKKASDGSILEISDRVSLKLDGFTNNNFVAYLTVLPSLLKDELALDICTDKKVYNITSDPLVDYIIEAGKVYKLALGAKTPTPLSDVSFTDETVAASSFAGIGIESDPYQVNSAATLKKLVEDVAAGNAYAGAYFELTTDLYINPTAWTPIGIDLTNSFSGHFDGKGHTITGKLVNGSTYQGYFGFFGAVTNGSVSNLSMAAPIELSSTKTTTAYLGGVVGYASSSSILNCSNVYAVKSDFLGSAYVGGIVGYARSTPIDGCKNYGGVNAIAKYTDASNFIYLGGIAGENYASLLHRNKNKSTDIQVTGTEGVLLVGGLVGNKLSAVFSCNECLGALTSWFGDRYQSTHICNMGHLF
ncbi:hypothetical protein [Bacteroides sp. 224]|uniref:hypothetical protein n=1 Tax=Bacteroides sp. 224 TaxID=2302936 RepID=UPI0013D2F1D0|nr:hypothetical protein [Bacteroides sp. 224]NDV67002.1 hypothetical protein [Bacteroides sp. 224]